VLAASDVLLAMIGKDWIGRRTFARARIHDPDDLVRIEVETALSRGVPLIPVLADGGAMPAARLLPESLQALRGYNAAPVETGRDFNVHMARLIAAIDSVLSRRGQVGAGERPPPP
jgi:hypothetical protein